MAAIGLDDRQVEEIRPLCGTLRTACSPDTYTQGYSWSETDLAIVINHNIPSSRVNVLAIGAGDPPEKSGKARKIAPKFIRYGNERETRVMSACEEENCPANFYLPLAAELSKQLHRADKHVPVVPSHMRSTAVPQHMRTGLGPPHTSSTDTCSTHTLIESTSGQPVAIRRRSTRPFGRPSSIAVLLPAGISNLTAWFRVFLGDVHNLDASRVPDPPPRLLAPADWYTPEERQLANRIAETANTIDRLQAEKERLDAALVSATDQADRGRRRVLWASGGELEAAVQELLTDLGFQVRAMDAELEPNDVRREDLRLTHKDYPGWEAIVEVKGYTKGTKTSDTRQIREHREHYIVEERRPPDLTLWITNPYRNADPSSRPIPDRQVKDSAKNVGAVHMLASDLYRAWALAVGCRQKLGKAVEAMVAATPGCWATPCF